MYHEIDPLSTHETKVDLFEDAMVALNVVGRVDIMSKVLIVSFKGISPSETLEYKEKD